MIATAGGDNSEQLRSNPDREQKKIGTNSRMGPLRTVSRRYSYGQKTFGCARGRKLTVKLENRLYLMNRILLAILTAGSLMSVQAAIHEYSVIFAPEALGATGSGTGSVFYDDVNHLLQMQATFSGLSGNVTVTHFHAPTTTPGTGTAGVAVGNPSLPLFPSGGTSGNYSETLDLTQTSVYNAGFLSGAGGGTAAGAETAFINAANQGRAYWNIHTSTFGGGEIRGFLTVVPEPSSVALATLGILGVAARVWSKRRENKP